MKLTEITRKSDAELQELLDTLSRQGTSEEVRFLAWCIKRHLDSKHGGAI